MDVGQTCQSRLARVHDYHHGSTGLCAQDASANHRVIFGDIRADYQDQVGLINVGDAVTHRS
ncbi:hypothetical protein D3C80_2042890 [compost metagenome]